MHKIVFYVKLGKNAAGCTTIKPLLEAANYSLLSSEIRLALDTLGENKRGIWVVPNSVVQSGMVEEVLARCGVGVRF